MGKTEMIHARIDPKLKSKVENILSQVGLTSSDAVNLLFKQIELNGGLPFEVKIPNFNAETISALKEAEQLAINENAITYTDIDSLQKAIET